MGYDWPGNVRQLMNTIERGVVLAEGEVLERTHLPPDLVERWGKGSEGTGEPEGQARDEAPSFQEAKRQAVRSFEVDFLSTALEENRGNVTRTASQLGMKRQSLQQKLRTLGIEAAAFRQIVQ